MAHTVTFILPERDLGKADAEFRVKYNGAALGTLKVSKGAVVWVPKDCTYGYKIGWRDFDKLMRAHGTRES